MVPGFRPERPAYQGSPQITAEPATDNSGLLSAARNPHGS